MTIQGKTVPIESCMQQHNTADYVWVAYDSSKERLPIAIATTAGELGRMLGIQPVRIQSSWWNYKNGNLKTARFAKVYIGGSDDE